VDAPSPAPYMNGMASILTIGEQRRVGAAARKVGGYDELIRLESERRRAKGLGHVERDDKSGRYSFVATAAAAKK
jgi:hypothetical protein